MWRKQSIQKVKTEFTTGKQASISVRPKAGGMQLVIAARLNSKKAKKKKRICLTLPSVQPFGISPHLGLFIKDQLERVVKEWRTLKEAQRWVRDQRKEWKKKVLSDWSTKHEVHSDVRKERALVNSCFQVLGSRMSTKRRATEALRGGKVKKTKSRLPLISPTVYTAKKETTHSIPIPVFDELRDGHVINRSIALHVYPRSSPSSTTRKPFGILMIPKGLAPLTAKGKMKRKEYSLGVKFGVDPEWLKFVAEYLGYVASRWQNLKAARRWCQELRDTFVKLLTQMWVSICDGKQSASRFWRIAASEVPHDKGYIAAYKRTKGRWGIDPDADRGSGLWCAKAGEHEILFNGPDSVSEPVMKPVKNSQSCYTIHIPADDDNVFAPTVLALEVGAVSHGFIVQHSRVNPTHKLEWDHHVDRPYLSPLRWANVNEEFTFNYGWDLNQKVES